MSRVLVTGASGFIGRHALPALIERGYEVHAVARGTIPAPTGVTAHTCDLLDVAATRALVARVRPSHLLHLAWYAVPGQFWTAPDNLDWVAASLGLLRAVAESGATRVVVAGTCAEYAWSHALLSESATPLAPATLYGGAKDALRACLAHAAPGLGLSWAWGRVFWLYGPHEQAGRLVPDVIASLLAGRRVAASEGHHARDFLHVEDVARAFVTLLDGSVQGPVNIGSGEAVPVRHVVERLGSLTGRGDLIDFGARPTPAGEPPRLVADARRLRDEVGFTPRHDLVAGLRATVDWYRSRQ